jgi:hypothetical protein
MATRSVRKIQRNRSEWRDIGWRLRDALQKIYADGVPDNANQGRFQFTGQMWIAGAGLYSNLSCRVGYCSGFALAVVPARVKLNRTSISRCSSVSAGANVHFFDASMASRSK